MNNRVWLEINLSTIKENLRKISQLVKPCAIMAVLKANAYGLGILRIAESLAESGVSGFGIAEINEALSINHLDKPVQILGAVLPSEIPEAVSAGIILPINDVETARLISEESLRQKKITECHFLVDTGMGRLGIVCDQAEKIIRQTTKLPGLKCDGIYTHFPVAYQSGGEYTLNQIKRFLSLIETLKKNGISFKKIHCANSDAINNFPFTYKVPFNMVRTGINIHGSFDTEGRKVLNLESVLTLKTRLAAIRTLKEGSSIGYGCTYVLPKETVVGTISAGYADGMPLALSNRGYVLVHGKPCPVLGRVSMDYTTISLEQVPEAKCGDEVICLGGHGLHAITVENWAQLKSTHPYEIICSFGTRVKRCYVN